MPYIRVEMSSLKEIGQALGQTKDQSNKALKAAINSTAKELKKNLMKGARQRYKMGGELRAELPGANKVKSGTVRHLEAEVRVTSEIGELNDYDVKPRGYVPGGLGRGTWVSGRAKKSAGYRQLALRPGGGDQYKAFVVKFKSGHVTAAQRVPGKMMRDKKKEAIKSLLANSITKDEEIVYREEYEAKMEDELAKAIQQQVERFLPVKAG